MNPARMVPGIIGAVIGGLMGAAIWGGAIYIANYEIGIIAWAIGGLVGFGGLILGARGMSMGIICGLIAALSICGGKLAGFQFMVSGYAGSEEFMADSRELYNEYTEDARLFAAVRNEQSLRQFMVSRNYTDESRPEQISNDEISYFREETEPFLKEWASSPPSFESWHAEESRSYQQYMSENISSWDILKSSISLYDILFFFLGVTTAFQIVASRPEEA